MWRRRVFQLFSVLLVVLLCHIESVHALDVTLAWDPNGESDLAGYKIYYATRSGGPYNGTGSSSGSSPIIVPLSSLVASNPKFTVRDLPSGTYYFIATAYDTEGLESGYSNQISASSAVTRYQLSASVAGGSGTISPASGSYNAGTVVTLTATPASGYRVSSWSGTNNNSSTSTTNTVTMSASRSVSVSFEQIPVTQYQLSARVASGNGTISPTTGTYKTGTVVTLTATPASGYRVASWTGTNNNSSTATTNTVKMGPNKNVTVSFSAVSTDNDGMADAWEIQWFGSITAKNGKADTDKDGLTDQEEYSYSRQNPSWGWKLNPRNPDSDKDGMPDGFEAKNGLNPTDATDKDLDSDHDGWTNFQEYLQGTNPNDAGSSPAAKAPRVKSIKGKKGVMPRQNEIAANDTGFAVLLESDVGIDTTDSSAVALTIEDGENTYQRDLLQENATGYALVQTAPVSGDRSVANEVWVVYYRSAETSLSNTWPFGNVVRVSVTAKDADGNAMKEPAVFTFEVENANSYSERLADRPDSKSLLDESGATVIKNSDTLATVTFTDDPPKAPYFDREETFDYPGAKAETVTVTLGPHSVFPAGATVFIPWRRDRIATQVPIAIFGFDGETWQPIIDQDGNDLTDGSWVVPGWNNGLSWQMVDDDIQSGVRIKVRHFSSFVGASGAIAVDTGTPVSGTSEAGSSGGCFITTIMK